jgi:hypothetical protein
LFEVWAGDARRLLLALAVEPSDVCIDKCQNVCLLTDVSKKSCLSCLPSFH